MCTMEQATDDDTSSNDLLPDPVESTQEGLEERSVPPTSLFLPPPNKHTAVDGQGMWRSWTRVFSKPESACLDLLDNCFDAALAPNFEGKVAMEEYLSGRAILIQNNSHKPIKKLDDALTVYKSSKNANAIRVEENGKDSIGENGVGLKQGCAALSDCSVVVTRNQQTVEIGIIAKKLQSSQGVYLPSFSFDLKEASASFIEEAVEEWLSRNPAILACLEEDFAEDVVPTLTQLVGETLVSDWQNELHVFLLLLCNLKSSAKAPHDLIESVNPTKTFLHSMKAMLPEHYINLPSFNFSIDKEPLDFFYWQRRLVELTRFTVYVSPDHPFETLPDAVWDKATPQKYPLNIYCGFDCKRVNDDLQSRRGTSTCHLYIYSCRAGRLIKKEIDARHLLGLSSSGVDFCQGLTVIVNDVAGHLPLTPTKDGIAWSEQASGAVHRMNLYAWTGAAAHFFWTFQRRNASSSNGNKANNRSKENLKLAIQNCAFQALTTDQESTMKNLEDADVSKFQVLDWIRSQAKYGEQWRIRRNGAKAVSGTKGPDTLLRLTKKPVQRSGNGGGKKRKNPADTTTNDEDAIPAMDTPNTIEGSNEGDAREGIWPNVDLEYLPIVTTRILSRLREIDSYELFELPVLETMPKLKEDYLKVVSTPMDFKTIETERARDYTSTRELQADLILVFSNCIRFNGASSEYGRIAQKMLRCLNDTFHSVMGKRRRAKSVNYSKLCKIIEGPPPTKVSTKPPRNSTKKKGAPSVAHLQRQLEAEKEKVKQLRTQLAASNRRILELVEGGRTVPATNPLSEMRTQKAGGNEEKFDDTTTVRFASGSFQRTQPVGGNEEKTDGDTAMRFSNSCCQVCEKDRNHHLVILCDGCDEGYHTYCLDPPLPSVPSDNWYCRECKSLGLADEVNNTVSPLGFI